MVRQVEKADPVRVSSKIQPTDVREYRQCDNTSTAAKTSITMLGGSFNRVSHWRYRLRHGWKSCSSAAATLTLKLQYDVNTFFYQSQWILHGMKVMITLKISNGQGYRPSSPT